MAWLVHETDTNPWKNTMEVILFVWGYKGKTTQSRIKVFVFTLLNCFFIFFYLARSDSFTPPILQFFTFFLLMELLAGNCRKRVGGDFDKMLTHSMSVTRCMVLTVAVHWENSRNDDVLATLAGLASPPQKLEPIRCVVKPLSQDKHPLDILAGAAASRLLWDDVEESGQLTRGFAKGDSRSSLQRWHVLGCCVSEVKQNESRALWFGWSHCEKPN